MPIGHLDRVSQYLICKIIYNGEQHPSEVFFRILLFKIFNRIETWELSFKRPRSNFLSRFFIQTLQLYTQQSHGGWPAYLLCRILCLLVAQQQARIESTASSRLLEKMMSDELPARLCDARTMAEAFNLLRAYPTIGDFLAYQYVTDINYSAITNFDEMSFVMPGPGARDGIRKCFSDLGGLSEGKIIELVAESQKEAFRSLGLDFQNLWGRDMQLIDCQNLFCEVDKYSRVKHPEFAGLTGRSKIKQKFHMDPVPLKLMYPPKWGLNARIPCEVRYVPSF